VQVSVHFIVEGILSRFCGDSCMNVNDFFHDFASFNHII